jgi:hypothetical protein
MALRISRVNDTMYISSTDGRVRLEYPVDEADKVAGIVDFAKSNYTKNDEAIPGQLVTEPWRGATLAAGATLGVVAGGTPDAPKKKKHREAKRLVGADGAEFKLADMIEAKVKAAKGNRISMADLLAEILPHYDGKENNARNAVRIAAMKSERFSIAGDAILVRVPSVKTKTA